MSMTIPEFIDQVIEKGIEGAKQSYSKPEQMHKLEGSIEGFEKCRGKDPAQLARLLGEAQVDSRMAMDDEIKGKIGIDQYWQIRCREAEIEWVCNCVSAVLHNQGLPVIINPTARAAMLAAEIVGVKGEE